MFLKIFKTEFVKNLRTFLIVIGSMILVSFIGGLICASSIPDFDSVEEVPKWLERASALASSLTILCICGGTGVLNYLLYKAFYNAVATDEAYLTFTLPISMKEQLAARVTVLVTWSIIFLVSFCVAISTYLFMAYGNGFGFSDSISVSMGWEDVLILTEAVLVMALVLLYFMFGMVLSILFSTSANRKHKTGSVVGIMFLISFLFLIATIYGVSFLTSVEIMISGHLLMLIIIVCLAALDFLLLYLSYLILEKKLNVA